jgi:hypothetical protein
MLKGTSPSQYFMTNREKFVRKRWFILNILRETDRLTMF